MSLQQLPTRYMAWRRGLLARMRARQHKQPSVRQEDSSDTTRGIIGAIIGFVIGGEVADSLD